MRIIATGLLLLALCASATAANRPVSYYEARWETMDIRSEREAAVEAIASRIMASRERYKAVEAKTGVPWALIGAIHSLEASGNFAGVLHNGERIIGTGRKTSLVPKGRGPFSSWESAAVDALNMKRSRFPAVWTIGEIGRFSEGFNGWGYVSRGIPSPYVWSYTNHYDAGKFVRDGVFDPTMVRLRAVSQQAGVMAILRALVDSGTWTPPVGPVVVPGPSTPLPRVYFGARGAVVKRHQEFLGVKADGIAGPVTDRQHREIFGQGLVRP